jgi:hypothetical protein
MKKIKIELTPDELASIIHMAGEKEKELYNLSLNKNVSLGLVEKLTVNLADSQKEATIAVQVIAAISRLTGIPASQIKDSDNLTHDLHMTSQQIRSLATSFTYIASQYKPGAAITPDECQAQETIQDCVDLIMKKIK